ncbi:hypothetical protein RHSIM_Rhsim04G0185100 [Rhododendron simsii]|uniref:Non-haem dioxygenase N-terminal domain-containing protein n=1 Tax=Rhododendron simsii TaxID=118357 RepID=A0A834LS02_RHOSS|nr:hypothetical protein RHSIM_Rhsim04G0185100 [Rhododendron simsii]
MDISGTKFSYPESTGDHFDRAKEVQAFDDSKAGVKGLIDAGVVKVPTIFIRPQDELSEDLKSPPVEMQVPVIDLGNIGERYSRERVVNEVRRASEEWGFFQVVNHGIPLNVLEEMIDGIRMFHEEDPEVKRALNSRDRTKKVRFGSNRDLHKSKYVNWRDTLNISMPVSDHLDPDEIPKTCTVLCLKVVGPVDGGCWHGWWSPASMVVAGVHGGRWWLQFGGGDYDDDLGAGGDVEEVGGHGGVGLAGDEDGVWACFWSRVGSRVGGGRLQWWRRRWCRCWGLGWWLGWWGCVVAVVGFVGGELEGVGGGGGRGGGEVVVGL